MIIALSPTKEGQFWAVMTVAWTWTQLHPRNYCANGGEMNLDEYLEFVKQPFKKHFAVLDGPVMLAVLTVDLFASRNYQFHVTAPIGTPAEVLRQAILEVGAGLFGEMNAEAVYTSCPVFYGVERAGMRRLIESCGMRSSGVEWQSEADSSVIWREYFINRETYYGQSETSIHH